MHGRDLGARRRQRDIDALEVELGEIAHLEDVVLAKLTSHANRALRGQRDDLVGREIAFGQRLQHFAADIAGGADHRDLVTHLSVLRSWRPNEKARWGFSRGPRIRQTNAPCPLYVAVFFFVARVVTEARTMLLSRRDRVWLGPK